MEFINHGINHGVYDSKEWQASEVLLSAHLHLSVLQDTVVRLADITGLNVHEMMLHSTVYGIQGISCQFQELLKYADGISC